MEQEGGLGRPAARVEHGRVAKVKVRVGLGQRVLVLDVGRGQVTHRAERGLLVEVVVQATLRQVAAAFAMTARELDLVAVRVHQSRGLLSLGALALAFVS